MLSFPSYTKMEQKNRPARIKKGYDLAAEALRHLANKLSSPTSDQNVKVRNELIRKSFDMTVEDILGKAKRLDELYQKTLSRGPWNEDPYFFSPLSDDEQKEINSLRSLICFALAVYGDDLSQTKKRISARSRKRNLSDDDDAMYLENLDLQLDIIEDTMREDYCG